MEAATRCLDRPRMVAHGSPGHAAGRSGRRRADGSGIGRHDDVPDGAESVGMTVNRRWLHRPPNGIRDGKEGTAAGRSD
jgi:hypothetical protein